MTENVGRLAARPYRAQRSETPLLIRRSFCSSSAPMTSVRLRQLAFLVPLLLASGTASAHGDDDRERTPKEHTETAGAEPGEAEAESRFSVGVDFVVGFGKTVA